MYNEAQDNNEENKFLRTVLKREIGVMQTKAGEVKIHDRFWIN